MLQILKPTDLSEDLTSLYASGLPAGSRTGWKDVDALYTVAPNYWTVVTGIPSHGKSTWLDCLLLNLMKQEWKVVIYSPEQQPHALHLSSLCEKYLQRPFRFGYSNRLTPSDIAKSMDYFEDKLRILRFDEGAIFPSLNTFMESVDFLLECEWTDGKVAVVLDPWNELDHVPLQGMNETQMTNWELMRWRQWVKRFGRVHGFIVAHPAKPQKDRDGNYRDVGLYDISGSSAWYNKSDAGIIIRRREDNTTIVDVEKCRWKHLGKKGTAQLLFNTGTGTYRDDENRARSVRRFAEDANSHSE
jgi:twinkle protein